ncbi:MAG: hypothetical protein GXY40_01305 [Syntrophomonadaceae bacterium]|jgi:hypothetical protein|nr:hypothetical protein [Syntrophomonadaceae bacterium]
MNNLNSLIERHYKNNGDIIHSCHEALKELYPELIIRWARIYGYRWAFIYGTITPEISTTLVKVRLSDIYGLCIDNAGVISPDELNIIINTLKEYFANDKFFQRPDS